MEKDRGGKIIAIDALLVGVVGLTVGFAAFSNTLTISSEAEYNPDASVFNVDFSTENAATDTATAGSLTPTLSPATDGPTGANATINNSGNPTITGIKATFTAPNQSVSYDFYTKNIGKLKAYLQSITFAEVSSGSGFKTCTPLSRTGDGVTANPASNATMTAACDDISLTLTVGSEDFTASKARAAFATPATAHDLEVKASEKVTLTITYAENGDEADGDFTVNFGDITFTYSSTES